MIKELKKDFTGIGEVRDFNFKQLKKTKKGYIYQVNFSNECLWYEVFARKINDRYNTVTYPKSGSFGRYAWTYNAYEDALAKLKSL